MTLPTPITETPPQRLTHLRPGEISLFRRFEALDPLPSAEYFFDVRLGSGMPIDPTWQPWVRAMATSLTQKRVDLVAHTDVAWWILEMKVRAGPGAVGQLLTYQNLFRRQYPDRQPVRLGIIADRNAYDMVATYAQLGIRLFLV